MGRKSREKRERRELRGCWRQMRGPLHDLRNAAIPVVMDKATLAAVCRYAQPLRLGEFTEVRGPLVIHHPSYETLREPNDLPTEFLFDDSPRDWWPQTNAVANAPPAKPLTVQDIREAVAKAEALRGDDDCDDPRTPSVPPVQCDPPDCK